MKRVFTRVPLRVDMSHSHISFPDLTLFLLGEPSLLGQPGWDSLMMGRASSSIKSAFKLKTFKGTAMYQCSTVRRILASFVDVCWIVLKLNFHSLDMQMTSKDYIEGLLKTIQNFPYKFDSARNVHKKDKEQSGSLWASKVLPLSLSRC